MNSLSWLLYWADVLPGISPLLGVPSVTLMIFSLCLAVFYCLIRWDGDEPPYRMRSAIILAVIAGLMGVSAALVPTRQTILLIAASEIGEQVIINPEVQEILSDLKERIRDELRQKEE